MQKNPSDRRVCFSQTGEEQVVKLQDQLSGREEERQKALKREVQAPHQRERERRDLGCDSLDT